jgi:general secretion pathway protein A
MVIRMYERYYGLRELPFELTPNPKYLVLTKQHREALSTLRYGMSARKGVTVLLGDAGTGKSTLVRTALDSERRRQPGQYVYLSNPALTRNELVEFIARAFELSDAAAVSKTTLLFELQRKLMSTHDEMATVLLVDEAQALSNEMLEEIRLLANLETDTDKLLPIVLAGQPELADKLNAPELRALKQRIALRTELMPLDLQETAQYIATRIQTAGGDCAKLFTREAVKLIYEHSRGIPRTISVICDNALVTGFAAERKPIGSDVVREVCRDFDLSSDEAAPEPAPEPPKEAVAPPADQEPVEEPLAATGTTSRRKTRRFGFF